MDKIIIRDLEVDTIIGIYEHERIERQNVIVNATLFVDLHKVGISDDFNDAVNYSMVEELIYTTVKNSEFLLVEKLANVVTNRLLELDLVEEVTLTIDKPKAAKFAKSIAIEINRKKSIK